MNGLHRVNVQFCTCRESVDWVESFRQLLRVGWYPASFERPKTAFTFHLLDMYHKLALQGKLNLYDFYSSILQKTDNCGRKKVVVGRILFHVCFYLLIVLRVPVSISRDVAMCSTMERLETNQTWWRRSRRNQPSFYPRRRIRT